MSILKLKNAGDEATMTIESAEIVQGQYGEQFKFSAGGDDLYVPRESALRQLDRLGFTQHGEPDMERVVGETLHFSRTAGNKPGVVYWNINTTKKNGAVKPTAAPKPRVTANVAEKDLPEFLRDATAQESAELHAKVGGEPNVTDAKTAAKEAYAWAQRQALKATLDILVPLYEEKEIGLTDDVVHKHAFELFKVWADKGLIA